MSAILKAIWDYLKINNRWAIALVIILLLLGGLIIDFQLNKIANLKEEVITEVNLKNALIDKVNVYQNKEKEWVTEKLTIQESVKNLEKMYGQLTNSQKELINRVKEVEKNGDIIAAALIETNIEIGKLRPPKVEVNDSAITFSDSTKNLDYIIEIGHVKPINLGIVPTLAFNKFKMPNKQFIEFHWKDEKKLGYPISFSVSNSNDYFKTTDISSYAIPELKKKDINPNGWNKITTWTVKNSKTIIYVGVGAAGGIAAYKLLAK
jgi:hypothetical protein